MTKTLGSALKVGDTITVWWLPGRDTITALSPYTGPVTFSLGVSLAEFTFNRHGMTIEHNREYELVGSMASMAAIG